MANQFNVGDVVQLKSGGPAMTIQSITEGMAFCIWFDGKKKEQSAFELKTLVAA
jgi:uncharacterized protein YodC (DUF2158 family)